jgi:hypothetical protein
VLGTERAHAVGAMEAGSRSVRKSVAGILVWNRDDMQLGNAALNEATLRAMLPATLQFLIVMIASAINDRLQRKFDYAQEEVRVLQEVLHAITGRDKISFTPKQRRRLATAGKDLRFIFFGERHLRYVIRGIHGALPSRAISPGPWWPTHRGAERIRERQRNERCDPLSLTARWNAQFLSSGGCVSHRDPFPDTTGDA